MIANFAHPLSLLFWILFIGFVISIHEASHALAAHLLGDDTAKLAGRLSLNPLVHLDILGTFTLFLFGFGWGKPTPFNPFNLRHPKRDTALIALAGPLANLLTALLISFVIKNFFIASGLISLLIPFLKLNLNLALFNLIPLFPLDGAKIIEAIIPSKYAFQWDQIKRFSPYILLFFILPLGGFSIFSLIFSPILNVLYQLLIL